MKEDLSLDELADVFSPEVADMAVGQSELLERNIVSKQSLELFTNTFGDGPVLPFGRILIAYMLDKLLQAGDINLDEGVMMLQTLHGHESAIENKSWVLVFIRKMGISSFLMIGGSDSVMFDPGTKVVARLSFAACMEELKMKMNDGRG